MSDKKIKEELIELLSSLIRIPSFSGKERNLVKKLEEIYRQYDFDGVEVDQYGSIVAKIKGNKKGPRILFDAHIDTVPVPEPDKWTKDPFGEELVDDKLYGRGCSDMKGALAAMILAAIQFRNDFKGKFSGEIYISGVVHEESFEGIGAREISKNINPDYVVIGEASELNLKIGQRGRAEIIVETYGKPAHSANPEKGINAVYQMVKLIEEIKKIEFTEHEILGKGILELTDIKSSPYPGISIVPDYCRATYDRRLLVGESKEEVIEPIKQIINKLEQSIPDFNAKVSYSMGHESCYTGNDIEGERFFPAWIYDKNEGFIEKIYAGLKKVLLNTEIAYYSFCTNGSHYAGEANIKTVGFGPSSENLAHTIDEYVKIEQLFGAFKGYYSILNTLLKTHP